MDALGRFDHPAWTTAAGTLVGYGLLLALLFVALFVVPFLVYSAVLG